MHSVPFTRGAPSAAGSIAWVIGSDEERFGQKELWEAEGIEAILGNRDI